MNRIKYLTTATLLCISTFLFAQQLDWLRNSTSADVFTSHGFYASTQHNGNFYFAGDFWKDLIIDDFDINIIGDVGNGFVLKLDESGTANGLWHFGSSDYVRINKIAANPVSESIIIAGYFRSNLYYNGQSWTTPFYSNGFLISLKPDGELEWIKEFTPQNDFSFASGEGLAIDETGNIFVGIEASGTVMIDNQSFEFQDESIGSIIAKFNINGELTSTDVWRNQSFEGVIDITDMALDVDNQLIIVGSVSGVIEIADSTFNFPSSSNQPFIIKQNNDLDLQWLKSYTNMRSHVLDIHIDEKDLILSLQYHNSINLDGETITGSGSWGDMLILSLNENAEINWYKNFMLSENGGIYGVYGFSISGWLDEYYIGGNVSGGCAS